MVILGSVSTGPFKFLPKVFGTCDVPWTIHLTAWIFGLFTLAIRPLTNKIPKERFAFMDAIDLETKDGKNCVTRWSDRALTDYQRMNEDVVDNNPESNSELTKTYSTKQELNR
jgi:hypothetical protein